MGINIKNFFLSRDKNKKIGDFQDLDHLDGMSVSTTTANLYGNSRDDLVLFYFRKGANYASVYTQSKIVSENIKWNQSIKKKKIKALLVNTRNANAFTGKNGYKGIKILADEISYHLNEKRKIDEQLPEKVKFNDILFASTGTIGEPFPVKKIQACVPELIDKIKYTQNKYIWMKAAMGILTTDLVPKVAMEQCKIGNKEVKIYGIAKGSGMIYPNMATTLGFVFTDATISSAILKNLLRKNIANTFNAITCDGDTSTNDMVTIFSTGEVKNSEIKSALDSKIQDFSNNLNSVLLNLAKRVAADGEGSSKFVEVQIYNCKTENDAKKIAFAIANSSLVKTALAGEDPNWGRIVMAIGKSNVKINPNKIIIRLGNNKIIEKGQLSNFYNENELSKYMKNEKIEIIVDLCIGNKNFTAYTMDLTKKYVEINSDYRT